MLLLISFLFLLATVLSAVAAYGAGPAGRASDESWPWWVWVSAIGAGVISLIAIPIAAFTAAP